MSDRKLINNHENDITNLVVADMLEQYGRELEEKYRYKEDIAPSPEAETKFKKSLNRVYKTPENKRRKSIWKK